MSRCSIAFLCIGADGGHPHEQGQRLADGMIIEVTAEATRTMQDYLKDKERLPVRIFLKLGGCGILSFGVVQEEAVPGDEIFKVDGVTYVIERHLLRHYGPIQIKSDGFSFRISGNGIHPPVGCGTCGYGCGSRGGHRCVGVCIRCENPCATGKRIKSRRELNKARN